MAESINADVERKRHRITESTDELATLIDAAEKGDSLRVNYNTSNGLSIVSHATLTEVDEEFGHLRFGDNYFHVNTGTGDYYFQDDRRESPEDGYQVTSVTLYK